MALNPDLTSQVQQGVGTTPRVDCQWQRAAVTTKTPPRAHSLVILPLLSGGAVRGERSATPALTPLLSRPPFLGLCQTSCGIDGRLYVGRTGQRGTDHVHSPNMDIHLTQAEDRALLSCLLSLLGVQAPKTERWSLE